MSSKLSISNFKDVLLKKNSMFLSTSSPNSTISSDPNEFFIITSETGIYQGIDFSFWCRAFVCGVEKPNAEIEMAFFIEFNLFVYCVDDSMIVLNWPEDFNTRIVLGFQVRVLHLLVC